MRTLYKFILALVSCVVLFFIFLALGSAVILGCNECRLVVYTFPPSLFLFIILSIFLLLSIIQKQKNITYVFLLLGALLVSNFVLWLFVNLI